MSGLGNRVQRAIYASAIVTLLANVSESQNVSAMQAAGSRVAHMTRHSFLFRWLTKEPVPEVIVIDLRETRTVGPIIRMLDWLIGGAAPYWEGSALKRALDPLAAPSEIRWRDTQQRQLARILGTTMQDVRDRIDASDPETLEEERLLIKWVRTQGYLAGQFRKLKSDTDLDEMEDQLELLERARDLEGDR